jgi:lysophospholipase L1-like esterase
MKTFVLILLSSISVYAQSLVSPIRYLALGDSYTIGQSVPENERWPIQLRDSLVLAGFTFESTEIIAVTGWRTDNLMNGIIQNQPDSNYNLVSLLIGVNNQFQGAQVSKYRIELDSLIRWSIALAQGNPNQVFMVSIPDYGYTPFGSPSSRDRISRELDIYNNIKDSLAQAYNIPFYYITDISRRGLEEPDLVANDNLHPSGKQYSLWVERILPQMLNTNNLTVTANSEIKVVSDGNMLYSKGISTNTLMSIYDIKGKLIESKNCDSDFEVKHLIPGIYLINLKTESDSMNFKVLIK